MRDCFTKLTTYGAASTVLTFLLSAASARAEPNATRHGVPRSSGQINHWIAWTSAKARPGSVPERLVIPTTLPRFHKKAHWHRLTEQSPGFAALKKKLTRLERGDRYGVFGSMIHGHGVLTHRIKSGSTDSENSVAAAKPRLAPLGKWKLSFFCELPQNSGGSEPRMTIPVMHNPRAMGVFRMRPESETDQRLLLAYTHDNRSRCIASRPSEVMQICVLNPPPADCSSGEAMKDTP